MTYHIITQNQTPCAIVESDEVLIADVQTALDLMMTVYHESGSNHIAIPKSAITEDFFKLSTGLAGEVLQKFVNYQVKLAIIGDFAHYTSKPLHDFIYECNKGRHIFFVPSEEQAVEKLVKA